MLRREPNSTNALFGPKWHRIYVSKWIWLAGYFALCPTIVGVIIWDNLFAVEGYAL